VDSGTEQSCFLKKLSRASEGGAIQSEVVSISISVLGQGNGNQREIFKRTLHYFNEDSTMAYEFR
jgi:hypothetical protein